MTLPGGVRRLLRLGEPERDVDEELSYHFERTVADLRAGGMTEGDARREAIRRFGDVAHYRRELVGLDHGRMRARRWNQRVEGTVDVIRHATRSLVRTPWLAVAIMVTLALGLGANVTMYGILQRLLLAAPPHVEAAEQVHRLMVESYSEFRGERVANGTLPWADVLDFESSTVLAGAAVWSERQLTTGHGLEARPLDGVAVSGNYFGLLGVRPALGRLISPDDDIAAADRVAVISWEMWQREYGGRTSVLGASLEVGGSAHAIIGVAPRGLTTLRLGGVDVWLPVVPTMGEQMRTARNWYSFGAVARRADGVERATAEDQLTALHLRGRAEQLEAGRYPTDARVVLTPLQEARGPTAGAEARVARWLTGVSLIVLLIACLNVANLLLARSVQQGREIAVRLALGISRRRLLSQQLVEGVLLGVAGGAAALLLARSAGAAMSGVLLPGIAWRELGWPSGTVLLALSAAALTGLFAAMVPAVHASRREAGLTLRQAGAGGISRATHRTRTALALVQSALSVVLLLGAGLFVRSLDAVRAVDLGLSLNGVTYVETQYAAGSATVEERAALSHAVLDRLRNHPGVEIAAATMTAPFMSSMTNDIRVPGRDSLPRVGTGQIWMVAASADYFRLLGIPIVHGRAFSDADIAGGARALIVNETMARALWSGRDPLGACVYVGSDDECAYVVGVARDSKQREFREPESMQFFVPLVPQMHAGVVMVRPGVSHGVAQQMIREAVVGVDPRIRYVSLTPATERLTPQQRSWHLGATLFSVFGGLALIVAALGLYAVLAFDTALRTREIGVRTALGASRLAIVELVLRRALGVAAAGVALGGASAALLAPRVRELLYGVGPHDPLTYAVVAGALLATAALAAVVPARRAAAVDPNEALRT